MAATWLRQVLTYRTLPTMTGVPSFSQGSILRAWRMGPSGDFHRHAICSLFTFALLIWPNGEYLVFALSPPYTGHSPVRWRNWLAPAPAAQTKTHNRTNG